MWRVATPGADDQETLAWEDRPHGRCRETKILRTFDAVAAHYTRTKTLESYVFPEGSLQFQRHFLRGRFRPGLAVAAQVFFGFAAAAAVDIARGLHCRSDAAWPAWLAGCGGAVVGLEVELAREIDLIRIVIDHRGVDLLQRSDHQWWGSHRDRHRRGQPSIPVARQK
ncbi:MAG: hypothetical protein RR240_12585, partial [Burkholderiaceae bacterium]